MTQTIAASFQDGQDTIWVWEEDLTSSHLRSTYVTRWSTKKPADDPYKINIRRAKLADQEE